ncbi:MAG: tetratricopeptide repeat protein [Nitrospirae bacterium]|nr:tetratricopeptide repeat protein [Nitrospirota bacterium]
MKKNILLIAATMLFLFANLLYASEADYEKHIAKGVVSLEKKNFDKAVGEFRAALGEKPDDPVAALYLGIALSRTNNIEAEAQLAKALSYNVREPRTNLELGIYYYNRGRDDEAREYFENTLKYGRDTEFAEDARGYLMLLAGTGKPRPWSVNLSVGEQYDSNVVLGPEDGTLSSNISRESDWRTVLYGKGKYNFYKDRNIEGSVAYSIYQSLHNRLNEFNVTQHLFELKGSYRISPVLTLKGLYSTEYAYVGWDDYDYAFSISPSLVISEGAGLSTEFEYKYKRTRFMDSGFFEDNSDRTGEDNIVGVTQNIPVNDFISAKAGYYYNEDQTAMTFWDYRGNRIFTEFRFRFPAGIYAGLNGEYYYKRYKDSARAADDNREDRIYTAAVSVSKIFMERFSVTAGQNYIRDDSNTAAYDYERWVTSLFLNVKF